jgi:hypothetical protein
MGDNLEVNDLTVNGDATFRETIFSRHFSRLGPTAVQGQLTVAENSALSGALSVAGHQVSYNPGIGPTTAGGGLSGGFTASMQPGSTDACGTLVLTSDGSGILGASDYVRIRFASTYPAPPRVQLTLGASSVSTVVYWIGGAVAAAMEPAGDILNIFVLTSTTFTPPAGTELLVNFSVVGTQPESV